MSTVLPPTIQLEIDRWITQQGWTPTDWKTLPVLGLGFSQSRIWRLAPRLTNVSFSFDSKTSIDRISENGFAIRCWGRSVEDRDSIQRILFFQQSAHHALNDSIVPEVLHWTDQTTCLEIDGSIWTIERWRPGDFLKHNARVSDQLLQNAFQVLERLHTVGRALGVQRAIAPGILERSSKLAKWSSTDWSQRTMRNAKKFRTFPSNRLEWNSCESILESAIDHFHRHRISFTSQLQRLSIPTDCYWVIRDLWRENMLIQEDQVTGIIDFGASRIDSPILESVRWLSSWLSPDDARAGEYLEDRRWLSRDEYRFFDYLSTLLSLIQWFDWLLNEDRTFEGRESRVLSRIVELDQRLWFF